MSGRENRLSGEIRPLTGVRGSAAFMVMLYHLYFNAHFSADYFSFASRSYLFVDLFFVLSGFVIALRYHSDFSSTLSWKRFGAFMAQRFGRIYPAYFCVSCLYYIRWLLNLTGQRLIDYDPFIIVSNILLIQGWGVGANSVCSTAWSVSAEMFVYLLFPLAVWLLARFKGVWLAGMLALLSIGGIYVVASSPYGVNGVLDVVDPGSPLPLVRGMSEFCLGMIAFNVARTGFGKALFIQPVTVPILTVLMLAFVLKGLWDMPFVLLTPILIMGLYYNGRTAAVLFGNPVVHWLGVISYSLYLVHPLCLDIAGHLMHAIQDRGVDVPQGPFMILGVALTLPAAALTQRYIEVPGRALVKSLLRRYMPGVLAKHAS